MKCCFQRELELHGFCEHLEYQPQPEERAERKDAELTDDDPVRKDSLPNIPKMIQGTRRREAVEEREKKVRDKISRCKHEATEGEVPSKAAHVESLQLVDALLV